MTFLFVTPAQGSSTDRWVGVEARDAANHSAMHRTASHNSELSGPQCQDFQGEESQPSQLGARNRARSELCCVAAVSSLRLACHVSDEASGWHCQKPCGPLSSPLTLLDASSACWSVLHIWTLQRLCWIGSLFLICVFLCSVSCRPSPWRWAPRLILVFPLGTCLPSKTIA